MRPEHLSARGARFIAQFEGFSSNPYNDPAGNATIGYGHLLHMGRFTHEDVVHWGIISRERGEMLLRADAEKACECVLRHVHPPFLLPWRFDAVVSLVFNIGCGYLAPGHDIYDALNGSRTRRGAADAFLEYDRASSGKRLPGLMRRRAAERKLFLTGRYS